MIKQKLLAQDHAQHARLLAAQLARDVAATAHGSQLQVTWKKLSRIMKRKRLAPPPPSYKPVFWQAFIDEMEKLGWALVEVDVIDKPPNGRKRVRLAMIL